MTTRAASIVFVWSALLFWSLPAGAQSLCSDDSTTRTEARFLTVSEEGEAARFLIQGRERPESLVIRPESRALLQSLQQNAEGDRLILWVSRDEQGMCALVEMRVESAKVPPQQRLFVMVAVAMGIMLCGLVCLKLIGRSHRDILVGMDNRYSNSKFQMWIWFGVLLISYISALVLRFWKSDFDFIGGVYIQQNLLLLSGASTATFAGAKWIKASKSGKAQAAQRAASQPGMDQDPVRQPAQSPDEKAAQPRLIHDLLNNKHGEIDLGDAQMLLIAIVAVCAYLIEVFVFFSSVELRHSVTLPDVDTMILAAFGLGQGTYLAKKAADPLGKS